MSANVQSEVSPKAIPDSSSTEVQSPLNALKSKTNVKVEPKEEAQESQGMVADVSKTSPSDNQSAAGESNVLPIKSDEQLEKEIEDALMDDQFLDGNELEAFCEQIYANEDLEKLNKMTPDKKTRLLIALLKDTSEKSEGVLDTVLPFMSSVVIKSAFKFYNIETLKNTRKQVSLLARSAYEISNNADENLIEVLRNSDENVLAESSTDTLFQIYRKQHLGDTYYRKLMKQAKGRMGPADFKKLFNLSAKITTTVYAYSVAAANQIMDDELDKGSSMTKFLISKAKSLNYDEQKKILAGLRKTGSLDSKNRVNRFLSRVKHKANIKKTFTDLML